MEHAALEQPVDDWRFSDQRCPPFGNLLFAALAVARTVAAMTEPINDSVVARLARHWPDTAFDVYADAVDVAVCWADGPTRTSVRSAAREVRDKTIIVRRSVTKGLSAAFWLRQRLRPDDPATDIDASSVTADEQLWVDLFLTITGESGASYDSASVGEPTAKLRPLVWEHFDTVNAILELQPTGRGDLP